MGFSVSKAMLIGGVLVLLFLAACAEDSGNGGYGAETDKKALEVVTGTPVYYKETAGYLAMPKEPGNYPGVVMIHEWWGLNDNIKSMADDLASKGYVVLAVDMYNGEVAETSERAGQLAGGINQADAILNMKAAAKYLRDNYDVRKIASLGWCFGGGQSLQLALSGEALDATVIYYGRLTSDEQALTQITWPVLGVFGETDQSITVQSVNEFQAALNRVGVTNEIYIYPGVGHAFANPSNPGHDPEKTRDAWQKTVAFLDKSLKT